MRRWTCWGNKNLLFLLLFTLLLLSQIFVILEHCLLICFHLFSSNFPNYFLKRNSFYNFKLEIRYNLSSSFVLRPRIGIFLWKLEVITANHWLRLAITKRPTYSRIICDLFIIFPSTFIIFFPFSIYLILYNIYRFFVYFILFKFPRVNQFLIRGFCTWNLLEFFETE